MASVNATSFAVLLGLAVVLVGAGIWEFWRHQRRIYSIPHRIHVNGTRGKSSVTRLIGAGLRAGGLATLTKVTGSFPRLILADGSDLPVHRKAAANILEQLDIVSFAAARGTEVLIIECMALEPRYQRITEEQMVHATLTVFTNIRLDHTDVMGRTLEEIGRSMANTIPRDGKVLTAEDESLDLVQRLCDAKGASLVASDAEEISRDDMSGFRYIEHRENVALALAVCRELGVDRQQALEGMWQAVPDAGVLTRSRVRDGEASSTFFNAFAANDPDSTLLVWNKLRDEGYLEGQRYILLNSRPDRQDRSEQLAHLVAARLIDEVDAVFVMGEPVDAVLRSLRAHGMPADRLVDLGKAAPERVYRGILERTRQSGAGEGTAEPRSSVLAIGNMGGQGSATVDYFDRRSLDG
ncbi:MAG: poly-gamma-glutamate synthase PgsB [Acidobacteriota bacterium]